MKKLGSKKNNQEKKVWKKKGLNVLCFLCLAFFLYLFLPIQTKAEITTPAAISTSYTSANAHYSRGENHIVNVGDTTVAIVSDGSNERLFRSTDHSTWTEILSTVGAKSSALITGPDNYVYYFYLDPTYDRVRMRKFLVDATSIPAATTIYSNADISSTGTGAYRSVNATIDEDGRIYVFIHYGSIDDIYCLVSEDAGSTWNSYLAADSSTTAFYGMTATVLPDESINLAYDVWGTDTNIWFTKSTDHGVTWSTPVLVNSRMGNPALLAVGENTLYVFGQSDNPSNMGVVFNKSENGGTSWQSTVLVEATCGYGDPSPALGSDGSRIWLIYRSSLNTGVTAGSCGDWCREVVAYSDDNGTSWTAPWRYYPPAERAGIKGHISYQPYYNYGGRIEWIWLQYTDSGTYLRTFHASSTTDTKYSSSGATADTTPPSAPSGLSVN